MVDQIEIWFSLVKKLLRRGNFASKSALRRKIEQFIAYFNETMAKPFRWTMEAKPALDRLGQTRILHFARAVLGCRCRAKGSRG